MNKNWASGARRTLEYLLRQLTRIAVARYHPEVIAICGSVGKTTAREIIYRVLSARFAVRRDLRGYQNILGYTLAVLGIRAHGFKVIPWTAEILKGLRVALFDTNPPQIVLAPLAFDRLGAGAEAATYIRPRHAVLLNVEKSHLEYFPSPEAIVEEQLRLLQAVPREGTVIINADDPYASLLRRKVQSKIITIGFEERADFMAEIDEIAFVLDADRWISEGGDAKTSMGFKVTYRGARVPVRLPNLIGYNLVYGVMAALATGVIYGISLEEGTSRLLTMKPWPGRLSLLRGVRNTVIIDDTFNASEYSMINALETLERVRTKNRRVVVLGDVLELGLYAEPIHTKIGQKAAKSADLMITVGRDSELAGLAYINSGRSREAWKHCEGLHELDRVLRETIRSGDVLLFKGSQDMRIEKAIIPFLECPSRDRDKLVRQAPHWQTIEPKFP